MNNFMGGFYVDIKLPGKTYLITNIGLLLLIGIAPLARADINLIGNDHDASASPVHLHVGGTFKLGYENANGHRADDKVARRGYADGSDFHAGIAYHFQPGWQVIGYYEMEGSYFKALGWHGHYHDNRDGYDDTFTHQLFVGIANNSFGTLTFGKQLNPFYTSVGAKTDIWIMDMGGQGPGQGIDPHGSHDGSYRANNLINYQKRWNSVNMRLSAILPGGHFNSRDFGGLHYHRKAGFAATFEDDLTPDVSWAAGISINRARLYTWVDDHQRHVTQHMIGTSTTWTPGQWTLAGMLGEYRNFIPDQGVGATAPHFFNHSAMGAEAYIGHRYVPGGHVIKSIEPYVAEATLRGRSYKNNDQFVGVKLELLYGVELNVEHKFAHNTGGDEPDVTHAQLVYKI